MFKPVTNSEIFQQLARKMKYGAPELKRYYNRFVFRGLLIAIAIHGVLIGGYVIAMISDKTQEEAIVKVWDPLDLKDPITENKKKEVLPDVKKANIVKDLAALTPDPVSRNFVKDEVILKGNKELDEIDIPVSSDGADEIANNAHDFGKVNALDDKRIDKNTESDVNENVIKESFEVERTPDAVNLSAVRKMMRYPEIALETGIEGRITVRVLVDKDGSVIKIGKISGPEVFYDEVSEKAMDLVFTPALFDSKPVQCWVSVPFSFRIKGKFNTETEEGQEE